LPSDREQRTSEAVAHGFRRGRPEDVAAVSARVKRILAYRGFRMEESDRLDIEQEVLGQLWRVATSPGFDPAAGFWGLVETVTVRRSIDWLRRRREEVPIEATHPDAGPWPDQRAMERETAESVRVAIARLGEPCRQLIHLRIEKGLGFRSISRRLGRSEGALRVQLHRCIGALRQQLAPDLPADRRGAAGRGGDDDPAS
jgi:RNA polymerase sigma-70 factor (ECF subfamily)